MDRIAITALNAKDRMRPFIRRIPGALTLAGFMLASLMPGIAAAGSRLGSEDMVFSYARESDRLVFGGFGYATHAHSSMDHPDGAILYMQDLKTGVKTKVFEAPNGGLGNSAIAPSGAIIAVQVYVRQGDTSSNPKLLVLTTEGKEVTAFGQSRDFAWSPDSRFLAYTTGIPDDGEVLSTGTWLYDQTFKTTTKVSDTGDFVAWSPTDNNLYIWSFVDGNRHISRYDPRTQAILHTPLRGIFFSPTGRYYHAGIPRHGEGRVEVYDAQSNQPVLSHRPRIAALMPSARIVGWAPEGDVLVLEVNRQELRSEAYPQGRFDTVLYDVAHDIIRVVPDDSVIGWQHGHAILHNRGKFTKRPLATLPLLPETPERSESPAKPPGKPFSPPKP